MADCFLYFRLWPGFDFDQFPVDQFNGIADDKELFQALDSWARGEIERPEVRRQIEQKAEEQGRNLLAALQKRRGAVASRPGRPGNNTSRRSLSLRVTARDVYRPRISQPERPEPLVCRFGFDLGWWRQVADDPLPFGPRVWFYQVASRELAETVVSHLNGRTDLDFDDHKEEYYLRPRFGFVEDADTALRISAVRCIESIKQGKIPEVRSGEMALAMGRKARDIADDVLEAAGPPTPVQPVLTPAAPGTGTGKAASTAAEKPSDKKPKKSTEPGEARAKIIAALTKWHKYRDGGGLNTEPVGVNALAKLADVSKSRVSDFFKSQFDSHKQYMAMCRRSTSELVDSLRLLNGDVAPKALYARTPRNEGPNSDDE